jgi:hypothetical protein
MNFVKPTVPSGNGSTASPCASIGTLLNDFAGLWEFLSRTVWEDGSRRHTCTLTITLDDGKWKGQLKDPNRAKISFLTGETPEALLESFNVNLVRDSLDWRPDKYFKAPKG